MSDEEIIIFILQTSKSQLIELLRVSTAADDELVQTIQSVIDLMD